MEEDKKSPADETAEETEGSEGSEETEETSKEGESGESEDDGGSEGSGEGTDAPSKSQEIDYKKIVETEQDRTKKAEDALARYRRGDERFKEKMKLGEEDDSSGDDNRSEGLTEEQLRAILREEREETRKESQRFEAKRIIRERAGSPDEASAVEAVYNNTSYAGDLPLEERVERAFFIVHGPSFAGKLEETRRALRSKNSAGSGSAEDTRRDTPKGREPQISKVDKTELKRIGFEWDGKQFVKKITAGTHKGKKLVVKKLGEQPVLEG